VRRSGNHVAPADTVNGMGAHAPSDHGVDDPTVHIEPFIEEPLPGWRKPIALAGWGALIAILIALIVWGIMQLAQGAPPHEPPTVKTVPTQATKAPTPPASSSAPVNPPSQQRTQEETTTPAAPATDYPTASTEKTATPNAPTATRSPSPGGFPIPQLPSVITLPPLPGLPTEITLRPPGL
jgi:hypothetical protein